MYSNAPDALVGLAAPESDSEDNDDHADVISWSNIADEEVGKDISASPDTPTALSFETSNLNALSSTPHGPAGFQTSGRMGFAAAVGDDTDDNYDNNDDDDGFGDDLDLSEFTTAAGLHPDGRPLTPPIDTLMSPAVSVVVAHYEP